jgi:hypothetical protein
MKGDERAEYVNIGVSRMIIPHGFSYSENVRNRIQLKSHLLMSESTLSEIKIHLALKMLQLPSDGRAVKGASLERSYSRPRVRIPIRIWMFELSYSMLCCRV